jgi:uncharacterized coiled-coil DUF342 family protein
LSTKISSAPKLQTPKNSTKLQSYQTKIEQYSNENLKYGEQIEISEAKIEALKTDINLYKQMYSHHQKTVHRQKTGHLENFGQFFDNLQRPYSKYF